MGMTPEERFAKIEEHLMVTAEMVRTSERRWEERFARHDEQIAALLRIGENHQARIQQLEDSKLALDASMLSLEAAMRALFERMDRFIRGLESNGNN
ncbi:MAG: hypothetical protein ABSF45_03050 [Terriglobia bacterium]|jgi:acyl carrier protein phosphodiesterase